MKLFRKVVDEREEQETKRIESGAYYIMVFALGISVFIQVIIFNFDIAHVAGEIIVLLIGVTWALAGYIRRGIWDNFTRPGVKSYLVYSTIVGIVYGFIGYFRSDISVLNFMPTFAIRFLWIFVIMFLILTFYGTIIKMRTKNLQQIYDEDAQ